MRKKIMKAFCKAVYANTDIADVKTRKILI